MSTFSLVLHAHMPYCRKAGTWPAGEEWLFEAILECYLPLVELLQSWQASKQNTKLLLGLVPILAEQLDDPYMKMRFAEYLDDRIQRAVNDQHRFAHQDALRKAAEYWQQEYTRMRDLWRSIEGAICPTLAELSRSGVCELMCSSATHAFLPLFESNANIRAQLAVGVDSHRRRFGQQPQAFWLPECAYRPAKGELPALDEVLAEFGLRYFFIESSGLRAAHCSTAASTQQGYRFESGVTVFARNDATGKQVWSPHDGYPGAPEYLEFHRKDPESGLRYWAVSQAEEKLIYDPERAGARLEAQARHFVSLLHAQREQGLGEGIEDPIIVAPYDAELFGHWWHEGVRWIGAVCAELANDPLLRCQSPGDHLDQQRQQVPSIHHLPPTSWGENGDFSVWTNPQHAWIWPLLNDVSRQLEALPKGHDGSPRARRLHSQIAREVLLLQGSDWPFLLHTGQAQDYANQRFHQHHQRLLKLLWAARDSSASERLDDASLAQMEELDNPWPQIDLAPWSR